MTGLVLRAYEEGDQAAIEAMAQEVVLDGSVFPFEQVAGVLAYWFSPGSHVVVAQSGETIVATYAMNPNQPDRGAHVCNVGYMVLERHRGRGLGRTLGEHSLETARSQGYTAMQFNQVVVTNKAAIRLWERLGFHVIGEVPGAFRHPELGFVSTLVMHREL